MQEEEILLVNGLPVTLDGESGKAIKTSLLQGNVPDCELLNEILIKAGILKSPVKLETSLSVKTSTTTKEEVTVSKRGQIVDGRSRETKENNLYTSETSEIWEPAGSGVYPSDTFSKQQPARSGLYPSDTFSKQQPVVLTTPSSSDDLDTSFSSCSSSDFNSFARQQPEDSTNNAIANGQRKGVNLQYSVVAADNSSSPNSSFSASTTGAAVTNANGAPYSKHSNTSKINYQQAKPLKYKDTTITSITETPSLSLSSLSSSLPSSTSSV